MHYKIKSAQTDANTARALGVVRFGHRPPARCHRHTDRTDYNTLRRSQLARSVISLLYPSLLRTLPPDAEIIVYTDNILYGFSTLNVCTKQTLRRKEISQDISYQGRTTGDLKIYLYHRFVCMPAW